MKIYVKLLAVLLVVLLTIGLVSCEDEGTGKLTVAITDAPITMGAYTVEEINLTVLRVDVVKKGSSQVDEAIVDSATEEDVAASIKDGNGVETVYEGSLQFNLLDFQEGVEKELGQIELEPGDYLQVRLVLDPDKSTIKFADDETQYPLTVPSGASSGLKIKGNAKNPLFTISENDDEKLVIDMDAESSIVVSTTKDGYKIKPVIKSVKFKNTSCEYEQE